MNNDERQKQRERIAFKKFAKLYFDKEADIDEGSSPYKRSNPSWHNVKFDNEVVGIERESPDYIIKVGDEQVGIEICEYMDSQRKESEKAKKDVMEKILDELNRLNMNSFYEIRLYWRMYNKNFKCGNRKNKNKLVNSVIKFFCDNYPKEDNVTMFDENGLLIHKYDLLNQYFSNIKIRRYDSIYKKNHVIPNGESDFLGIDRKILTDIVQKKEEKIKKYKREADKIWLLIPVYEEWFSNMVNWDAINKLNIHDIPINTFDKLFILDIDKHTLKEIC
ncbi:hypothetical protein [Clostridium sp.]|jgi:hypothetical protein|uniref:hypothetical protein n=1 Tax=Clostridium sp. TaxID=1506 RepID=UPI003EE9516A